MVCLPLPLPLPPCFFAVTRFEFVEIICRLGITKFVDEQSKRKREIGRQTRPNRSYASVFPASSLVTSLSSLLPPLFSLFTSLTSPPLSRPSLLISPRVLFFHPPPFPLPSPPFSPLPPFSLLSPQVL